MSDIREVERSDALTTAKPDIDVPAILGEGAYYILDDYALREEMYSKVIEAFLDGVEQLEGAACREKIKAEGLGQLHKYFPVEKIHLLESFLQKKLRNDLYYWSYRVGRDDLHLKGTFYLDHLIMLRIHYPFLVAREAGEVIDPPYPLSERMGLALSALKDWRLIGHYFKKRKDKKLAEKNKTIKYDAISYHGNLPVPARAHAAHVDTWYGHSYDGVNLWWSIQGVNEDNTVILYPDMFGQKVDYDPVSMYLAGGIPVTRPVKVAMKPAQLLVFNPETLHGTQVNISDETRVAITTRLNPHTPRFNSDAPFNFEHWYSSDDLAKKKFSSMSVFPAKKYHGEPSIIERPAAKAERTVKIECAARLSRDEAVAICPAADLRAGEKMSVTLENAKALLWRDGDEIRAYSRICPHLGVDLEDGYHDESQIFCPGHGISYALHDGASRCEAFKLRQYRAYEDNGTVYLLKNI